MTIDTTGMASETAEPAKASDILSNIPEILGIAPEGEEDEQHEEPTTGEGSDGEGDSDAEGEAEGEASTDETEGEGEGKEEEVPVEPTKKLATEFSVSDAEGELEIPELTIKFKASGQERELPLDKVVKLAQQGYYNEEREQQVREFREAIPQWQQAVQERDQLIQTYASAWERVLAEGAEGRTDTLEAEIKGYMGAKSPESRARQAEAELQALRSQQASVQVNTQAQQFVSGLTPKFEALAAQAPDVGQEAIFGKFNLLMAPLMVRGQVPPNRFAEAARIIDAELVPWVESQQEKVSRQRSTATEAERRQAAVAADAKRKLSRVTRPQGGHAPEAPRPQKKIQQASDLLSDESLKEMVSGIGGRR